MKSSTLDVMAQINRLDI